MQKLTDGAAGRDTVLVVFDGMRMRLRDEIKKRRISETAFAELSGVSHTWLRRILAGEHAGEMARAKIRTALTVCTVCGCEMTVPNDEELFAVASRKKRRTA